MIRELLSYPEDTVLIYGLAAKKWKLTEHIHNICTWKANTIGEFFYKAGWFIEI